MVERYQRFLCGNLLEEVPLRYLLPREEHDAISPVHADIARVVPHAHMPLVRGLHVDLASWPVSVLVEDKLRVVYVPREDQCLAHRLLHWPRLLLALCDVHRV